MEDKKYTIYFTDTAIKSLKSFNKSDLRRIIEKIELLSENPFIAQNVKKLVDYDVSYRLRVGNYRVLFEREDKIKIISIIDVRHRKESYRRN